MRSRRGLAWLGAAIIGSSVAVTSAASAAGSSAQPQIYTGPSVVAQLGLIRETPAQAGVRMATPPPVGFNPLTATTAELTQYGIPVGPPAATPGYAAWAQAMSSAKTFLTDPGFASYPTLPAADASHVTQVLPQAGPGPSTIVNDTVWGGNVDRTLAPYSISYADWYVPPINFDNEGRNLSIWPGLGGGQNYNDPLLQGGSEGKETSGLVYDAWWEAYPQNAPNVLSNLAVHPGDHMFAWFGYQSPNAQFFIENETYGTYASFYYGPTQCACGSTEWIVERANRMAFWTGNLSLNNSTSYSVVYGWQSAGTPPHESHHLIDRYGNQIAYGGAWLNPPTYSSFPVTRTTAFDYGG